MDGSQFLKEDGASKSKKPTSLLVMQSGFLPLKARGVEPLSEDYATRLSTGDCL